MLYSGDLPSLVYFTARIGLYINELPYEIAVSADLLVPRPPVTTTPRPPTLSELLNI